MGNFAVTMEKHRVTCDYCFSPELPLYHAGSDKSLILCQECLLKNVINMRECTFCGWVDPPDMFQYHTPSNVPICTACAEKGILRLAEKDRCFQQGESNYKSGTLRVIKKGETLFPKDDELDDSSGKRSLTRLVVTMPNGTEIDHSNASDTFVEVIEMLGIQQVKNLNKMLSGFALISTANHLTLTQREVDGYYLVTHSDTKTKKGLLEEIARDLGVTLKVEIVPKD